MTFVGVHGGHSTPAVSKLAIRYECRSRDFVRDFVGVHSPASMAITVTGDAQVSAAPGTLSFTTANWNVPQTVTVTAVDDAGAEGAHTGSITHSASGGGYNGVTVAAVTSAIADNDSRPVIVSETAGSTDVSESGTGDSYSAVLGSQPTGTVTVSIAYGSQISAVPTGSLTFTSANWNTPQLVSVNAVDDTVAEGPHTATISHGVSGGGYDGLGVAGLTVNITDNDPFITDLAITNSLISGPLSPGQRVTYEVSIDNLTAGVVANAPFFNFGLPAEMSNVTWVCTADVGAFCPASGSGLPLHTISMAGGTGVLYWISADLAPATTEGTAIQASATIEANDTVDPQLSNNAAIRTDLVGPDRVFKDGFE